MSDRANVRISLTSNDDGKDCIRVRIGQEDFGLVTYEEVAEWLKEAAHKKWPRVRCPEDAMHVAALRHREAAREWIDKHEAELPGPLTDSDKEQLAPAFARYAASRETELVAALESERSIKEAEKKILISEIEKNAELVAALRQAAKDLRKAQFNDPRDHYAAARKIEALLSRYPETERG